MPRLAPDACQEMRVTLGTYERNQLKKFANSYRLDKQLENIPNIMLGVGGVIASVGVCAIGYGVWKIAQSMSLEWLTEPFTNFADDVKDGYQNVKDGTKTAVDEIIDTMQGHPMQHPYTYTTDNPPQPVVLVDPVTGEECLGPTPDWRDENGVWHAGSSGTCSQETISAGYTENPLGVPNYES